MDLKTYIMYKTWTYLIYNNIYKILIYSWDIFKKPIWKVKISTKTVMQKSIIFNAYIHVYIYILIYTIYKYNIDIVIILQSYVLI